ncbi:unnamed protein product [Microthlaspi erraticum]|uniref:Uncharacterized protein n=1 Tax=Microthlaspi erraticum TaxID=1685480 RepID=A0A6D2KIW5_9BRAS|nr:unnamed protein product [Microthlaspi erraticum]
MDFIKTSSLRALIELTFQRNWNGIIWMSRKGVITKRVKTVQTALSREQRQTALGQSCVRPTEVSAKVQNHSADHASRPGKLKPAVGHATTPHQPRTTKAREPGKRLAAAQLLAYHGRTLRPSRETPASGRDFIGQFIRRPRRPTVNPSDPTVPTRPRPDVRPIVPPTVPTPRSTRSPFEAQTYVFKPGLTLAASRKT